MKRTILPSIALLILISFDSIQAFVIDASSQDAGVVRRQADLFTNQTNPLLPSQPLLISMHTSLNSTNNVETESNKTASDDNDMSYYSGDFNQTEVDYIDTASNSTGESDDEQAHDASEDDYANESDADEESEYGDANEESDFGIAGEQSEEEEQSDDDNESSANSADDNDVMSDESDNSISDQAADESDEGDNMNSESEEDAAAERDDDSFEESADEVDDKSTADDEDTDENDD